jgi:hypothetical protein
MQPIRRSHRGRKFEIHSRYPWLSGLYDRTIKEVGESDPLASGRYLVNFRLRLTSDTRAGSCR